jgi:hypothetical protein
VNLLNHLSAGLNLFLRSLHLLDLQPDPLNHRLQAAQLLDLRLHLAGPYVGVGQPGLSLSVALADAAHLLISHPHLLQAVGQELASALEGRQLLDRLLHTGPDLIQPPHPGRQVRGHAIQPGDVLPQRARAGGLLGERLDFLGEVGDLLAHVPNLVLYCRGALSRRIQLP